MSKVTNSKANIYSSKTTISNIPKVNQKSVISSNSNNSIKEHKPINHQYTIGDFQIETQLGEGAFGKVFLGSHNITQEKVAIKIINKSKLTNDTHRSYIENEITIHKQLYHESIVKYYSAIETKSTISMISEYCPNGELFAYISNSKNKKLSEKESCCLFQQLISGIDYLHQNNITHRDIKLDNLLLSHNYQLKIVDFGLSKQYNNNKSLLTTKCGSPCYVAPEILSGQGYNGEAVDIWSSGVVLYSMLNGHLPFYEDNQAALFNKISNGEYTVHSDLSNSCLDLIKLLLCVNPQKRITIKGIREHAWFSILNYTIENISSPGIFLNKDIIPLDEDLLYELHCLYQYDIKEMIRDLMLNKHSQLTISYYLHLNKKIMNNQTSIGDISSSSKLFADYIQSEKSKLSYFKFNIDDAVKHYQKKLTRKFTMMKKKVDIELTIEKEKDIEERIGMLSNSIEVRPILLKAKKKKKMSKRKKHKKYKDKEINNSIRSKGVMSYLTRSRDRDLDKEAKARRRKYYDSYKYNDNERERERYRSNNDEISSNSESSMCNVSQNAFDFENNSEEDSDKIEEIDVFSIGISTIKLSDYDVTLNDKLIDHQNKKVKDMNLYWKKQKILKL